MRRVREALTAAVVLAAGPVAGAGPESYVAFDSPDLAYGRDTWLANCEGCHGYGIAGAPVPVQADDWRSRLAKGKTVLYEHAINGFYGPDDTVMPARGGNPQLSDAEVMAAVDYMAALATFYIQKER
jgi:cytochrome c5